MEGTHTNKTFLEQTASPLVSNIRSVPIPCNWDKSHRDDSCLDEASNHSISASRPTSSNSNIDPDHVSSRYERQIIARSGLSRHSTFQTMRLSTWHHLKTGIFARNTNGLLVFFPLGIIADVFHWSDAAVFVLNLIAIIPLAKLHSHTADDICSHLGEVPGTLAAATLRNAAELILAIIVLKNGEIDVVRASVLGSILFNLLLVLGCYFLAGGIKYKVQTFNQSAAQMSASLLALSCLSLIIPAAHNATSKAVDKSFGSQQVSYGLSIILLVVYALYLLFQIKTHQHLYEVEQEEQKRRFPLWLGVLLLAIFTIAIAICGEYLVDSMSGLSKAWGINPTFIGMVLLPIVSKAFELFDAISIAMKNKAQTVIEKAIGSSTQTAPFIAPVLVI
ncbi:hypothetical protein BGZ79_004699, partial [Entomortierella chlamydospora]